MRNLIIAVAAMAATSSPAMAETKAENGWLTLNTPTTRDKFVFDGAVWRCKADVCRSTKVKSLPPLRSCKRLARKLGTITGFSYHGVTLSETQLADCNPVQIAPTPATSEVATAR